MIVELKEEYNGYVVSVASQSTLGSTLIDYTFIATKDGEIALEEFLEREKEGVVLARFEEFKQRLDNLTETNTTEESEDTNHAESPLGSPEEDVIEQEPETEPEPDNSDDSDVEEEDIDPESDF